jgi:16S rRNA (guanine966-N2)-methyltransferase
VRIISGQYKGRKLAAVGKGDAQAHLRPTTDRVRETLFNILINGGFGDVFDGGRALDLFAGTGALGIEAFSRGLETVWMIDSGRKSRELIHKNIDLLGNPEGMVFKKLNACKLPPLSEEPFNIVFLDPPYGQNLGRYALESALQKGWIAPQALIVCEENTPMGTFLDFKLLDSRQFGNTFITIMRAPPNHKNTHP